MRIENLSIKTVTVFIYAAVGVLSILLSMLASSYFKQAALNAQIKSLSRVMEVASQEVIREISGHAFELGMKLGHNPRLLSAMQEADEQANVASIVEILNDPFINGFPGFAEINLVKLRLYTMDLELLAQSEVGEKALDPHLPSYLAAKLVERKKIDRLKAIDALWQSPAGPLFSTLVPVGGLRAVGYLEVVIDPAFNLPQVSRITKTPVQIVDITDTDADAETVMVDEEHLPVSYMLHTSAGRPVFRIVGYEDVSVLLREMGFTQVTTTGGFILITLSILTLALWMFHRFLFVPMDRLVSGMRQISDWRREVRVDTKGLREFTTLAQGFEDMAGQIRVRNSELERLLDLDESAILCIAEDGEVIYLNRAAVKLFRCPDDEIDQLDLMDLIPDAAALSQLDRQSPEQPRQGYLEVVIDPAFNLPQVSRITKTPVQIVDITDTDADAETVMVDEEHLPVSYMLHTSAGRPVFRIVGYEDVSVLLREMGFTQVTTTGGFILITLSILTLALWMFHRFLFVPMDRLVSGMRQISDWRREVRVDTKGLREFTTLAQGFEDMAGQIRVRNSELERLLDLDESAILCIAEDGEVIYLNRAAVKLFRCPDDEIDQLDLMDLIPDAEALSQLDRQSPEQPRQLQLACMTRDGHQFEADAVINLVSMAGGVRLTLVMQPRSANADEKLTELLVNSMEQNEQRLQAVEASLDTILALARSGPDRPAGGDGDVGANDGAGQDIEKTQLKETVVRVMNAALACWERDLGKSKLDLAEESGIWPVYIDKSTPTTRTLDRYLHIESCPQNPRSKRVIATAEFVLKRLNRKSTALRAGLQQALDELRHLLSGLNDRSA